MRRRTRLNRGAFRRPVSCGGRAGGAFRPKGADDDRAGRETSSNAEKGAGECLRRPRPIQNGLGLERGLEIGLDAPPLMAPLAFRSRSFGAGLDLLVFFVLMGFGLDWVLLTMSLVTWGK